MGNAITFQINAFNNTNTAFNAVTRQVKELGEGRGSIKGLVDSLGGFTKAIPFVAVAGEAFKKVTEAASVCEEAFVSLEKAEKKIDFAANLNSKLGATSTALKRFASQLSKDLKGSLSGEDILSAMGPLAFDKSADQLKKITAAAADLSAVTGESLDQSIKKLSATLGGEAGELANIFPKLKTMTTEQRQAGAAIDYVAEKVLGAAAAMSDSANGSMARYKNATQGLRAELGASVTSFFSPLRNWLSSIAEGWRDALEAKRQYNELKAKGDARTDEETVQMYQLQIDELNKNKETTWKGAGLGDFETWLKNQRMEEMGVGLTTHTANDPVSRGIYNKEFLRARDSMVNPADKTEIIELQRKMGELQKSIDAAAAKAGADKTAEDSARALKMGLEATVLEIQNKIASGEIDKVSGDKRISVLTDDKYLAALAAKNSKSSSPSEVAAAGKYLAAYEQSWTIKEAAADKEHRDAVDKANQEALKNYYEYNDKLNSIINDGLTPARKALVEWNQKNKELLESLQGKAKTGSASNSELAALAQLIKDQSGLQKDADSESPKSSMWSKVFSALKSKDSLNQTAGIISSFSNPNGNSTVNTVIESLAASLGPLAGSFSMITQLLNPLQVIFTAMFQVLAPVIENLLAPLLGILSVIGTFLGTVMTPILMILEPIITAVSTVFVWFYNKVMVPVGNGIQRIFVTVGNFFIDIINGVISALNHIPFVDINHVSRLSYNGLDTISIADLTAAGKGTAAGSGSSGGSATYSGAKDVYINIYYQNSYVNGDAREIALNLRKEIKLAEAMGY